jgi:hypothetical protein
MSVNCAKVRGGSTLSTVASSLLHTQEIQAIAKEEKHRGWQLMTIYTHQQMQLCRFYPSWGKDQVNVLEKSVPDFLIMFPCNFIDILHNVLKR